jgi:transcriptional regulator with PAS, ATPase and Fis domain
LSEPLLVLGETGSGKEYVVRWLHRSGAQASGPFVEVNCAQLSREFARTELFGIEPKTASGVDGRKGLVSAAHGGTLFLDEVGDLPEEVQPELLRFLQDGSFVRLGSHTIERSNARVIAATHRDLSGEVERGAFRRDLYARLTIARAPLVVPPLRERAVDILDWAARFLRGRSLTAGAAEALLTHPWLANLRELERVIRTAEGEVPAGEPVRRRHLELEVPEAHEQAEAEANGRPERTEAPELTKARLIEVLAEEKGVIVRVAARLGIDRRSVYRACERFDVDHTAYRDEKEA